MTYRYLIVGTGYCSRLLNERRSDWLEHWEEDEEENEIKLPFLERLKKKGFVFIEDSLWARD
ncbi:MAG: hypothetical protein ACYCQJ_13105 [Nitrososphaerales archaeon]